MGARGKNRRKNRDSIIEAGKATRFQPGVSGNPKGRPRTAKFSEACREIAAEADRKGKTGAERLARYCFRRALRGSAKHTQIFLNYAQGRPKQLVELSGPDGSPLTFHNLSRDEIEGRVLDLVTKAAAEPTIASRLKEVIEKC